MDELKASPRNEALWNLAQKLRRAPAALGRASPVLGALAGSGSEMLTEPIARGLEHWAYGDRAFGPPAGAPLVTDRTLDMASALPLGAMAQAPKAAAASFVPLFGRKGAQAAELLSQGASSDELWSKLQALAVPRRPKDVMLPGRRFLTEIDDSKAAFKVPFLRQAEKEQLAERLGGDPLKLASALRRANNMAMPMPGEYRMEDLLYHPELFQAAPTLRDASVRIGFDPKLLARGQYTPQKNAISLNLASHMTSDTPGLSGPMGTLLHEGGHGIQHAYNLPGGSSPSVFQKGPEVFNMAQAGLDAAGPLDSRTRQQWERLLRLKNEPYRLYRESPGEQLATATQDRLHLGREGREAFDPNQTSFTSFESAVDPLFAHHALSASEQAYKQGLSPAEVAQALRKWGTIR
jgi:hypothetical protein